MAETQRQREVGAVDREARWPAPPASGASSPWRAAPG
jgi:hypothetical protein